jgi:hypothetical protein
MTSRRFYALLRGLSSNSAFLNVMARKKQKSEGKVRKSAVKNSAMKKSPQEITRQLLANAHRM